MVNVYFYCKDSFVSQGLVDFFQKQKLENINFKVLKKGDIFNLRDILILDKNLINSLWLKPALVIELDVNTNLSTDHNYNILNTPFRLRDLKQVIDSLVIKSKAMICFNNVAFLCDNEDGVFFSIKKEIENQKFRTKEALFLKTLLEHYPNEIARPALLKSVWGFEENVNTHTLETHLATLRKKLSVFDIRIIKNDTGYKLEFIEVN